MPVFRAADLAVIRLAALPRSRAEVTRVDLDPERDGYEQRLTAYLLSVTGDPLVREALAVSSGSLADTISKIEDGGAVERAKLERAAFAATRYLLRMAGRPTPFGLLAGVQRVEFGDTASVRVGDRHHKAVRPDTAWLSGVLAKLSRSAAVRDATRVAVNNLCAVRGDRLVLGYVRPKVDSAGPDGEPARELSVRCGPVVRAVLDAAARPIAYPALRDAVLAAFPQLGPAEVDQLLGELVEREVLLTDLLSRRDAPDRLALGNELLADVDEPGPAALRAVAEQLAEYERRRPGDGLKTWQATVSAMGRLLVNGDRPPVHVDLRVDADIRLPREVASEVAAVGDVLWRLAPPMDSQPQLSEYRVAFVERYGLRQLVSVLDVLDPHVGLGPPAGYQMPRGERGVQPPPANPYPPERDQLVASLAMEVIGCGGDELVLDDALVDRLAHGEDVSPPMSLDICAELHASSAAALDRGDFRVVISTGAGSLAAGAMAGRFARLLDVDEALGAVIGQQAGESGPVLAQLYFQPSRPRYDNVALIPRLLPSIVSVGVFADPGPDVIDVRDLAVGATEDRLYLVHGETGREVVVLTPHMLQFRTSAPNVARFLTAVAMSGTRSWTPWQWGSVDALPFLPRVRYRRTVLSPARWRPSPELRDRNLPWPRWRQALDDWRQRFAVPDVVRVSVLDHHVDLDLTVSLHQQLLRRQLTRSDSGPVLARESPRGGEGWLGGHVNEIVVPLVSTRQRPAIPAAHLGSAVQVRHHPGGDWLFAKVYAVRDAHDALLRRHISALVERLPGFVDRWFFVRYLDPDAHVRLRLRGPADRLNAELLPLLRDWADALSTTGAIRKIVLDTYEPEVHRYGGPDAIDDAERLFHADSEAVIGQLTERASGRLAVPIEVLAAMNYVELLAALGSDGWDWPAWVLGRFPIELQKAIRPLREPAFAFVDPLRAWTRLREQPGADAVLAHWARRADAAARYGARIDPATVAGSNAVGSVLHLHANRLIGIDRDAERVSYGILRAVARAHTGRLRNLG